MNEFDLRTNSSEMNNATMIKQLVHEEVNTAYNHHVIIEAFKSGRAHDIADEPTVDFRQNAIVIGSGPSLDLALPHLKNWKGAILCTTSHALTLMRFGIEPTYIVVLDPFCEWKEIEGVDWSKTKTKLITHPGVWPDLIANWPNEFVMYIQNQGRPESFYQSVQKIMYSHREYDEEHKYPRDPTFMYYIKTEVIIFACSPAIQIFFADKLKYRNTFLVGVDFGYTYGKERFTEYTPKKNSEGEIEWEERPHELAMAREENEKIVYSGNGIPSQAIHLYYKKNLISAWRLSLQTLYTTDKGTITEIPFAGIEKVVKTNGFGFPKQRKEFIIKSSERYLAKVGAYVICTDEGISFIEAIHGMRDLTEFMKVLDSHYICSACHREIEFQEKPNDPPVGSHEGQSCPICKQEGSKLKKKNHLNIKDNLKRLERLAELDAGMRKKEKVMEGGPNDRVQVWRQGISS